MPPQYGLGHLDEGGWSACPAPSPAFVAAYPRRPWRSAPRNRGTTAGRTARAHVDGGHLRWSVACSSGRGREVRKTVGSAYVGSNPTPATTCENGPHQARSGPGQEGLSARTRSCRTCPSCTCNSLSSQWDGTGGVSAAASMPGTRPIPSWRSGSRPTAPAPPSPRPPSGSSPAGQPRTSTRQPDKVTAARKTSSPPTVPATCVSANGAGASP